MIWDQAVRGSTCQGVYEWSFVSPQLQNKIPTRLLNSFLHQKFYQNFYFSKMFENMFLGLALMKFLNFFLKHFIITESFKTHVNDVDLNLLTGVKS